MRFLDRPDELRRKDPSGMLRRAAALPVMALDGWRLGLAWRVPREWRRLENLAVLGMGGSAIGGEILQGLLGDGCPRPIFVNRTYSIPRWIGPGSLVLACSYSGNTEETLSAAAIARRQGAKIAVITSGGKLAAWARRNRYPLLLIPQGLPPRSAVGYLTFAPLGMLARLGWVPRGRFPVEQICRRLQRYVDASLAPGVASRANPAKRLAAQLQGRLPVIYGGAGGWEGIAYRWRTQIEENSKSLCFHHIFPEATHNEISAWLHPPSLMKSMAALFLTDPAVHPRTLRRMEFTRRLVRGEGARAILVSVPGGSLLERMLKLIALGDFVSVYLGLLYKIDPTPVVRVEALKRFMKK